jgi:hypothetical protein
MNIEELKITLSDTDIQKFYDLHRFKGYNKDEVIKMFINKVNKDSFCEVLVICAVTSPIRALEKVMSNGKTLRFYGFGSQPKDILTPARIQNAFAQVISDLLYKLKVPKKLPNLECPAHLQFFGAASLKLSVNERKQHIEFCKEFSTQIGGSFRQDLYDLSRNN